MANPGSVGDIAFWGDLTMVYVEPDVDVLITDTTDLPSGFWLPMYIANSDNLLVRCYSDGTEADSTELAARNTTATVGVGTITYAGTHQRLQHLAADGAGFTWVGWAPGGATLTTTTKIFMISEVRAELAGTTAGAQTNNVGWFIGDGTSVSRWQARTAAPGGVVTQTLQAQAGGAWSPVGLPRGTGQVLPALASTPEFVMIADEGQNSSVVYRGTQVYAAERRTMGTSAAIRAAVSAGVSPAPPTGNNATMDVLKQYVFTY
jgi:hypothetical protein